MPKFTKLMYGEDVTFEYATEQELLAFANKLRAAGAADPLDALMPSRPGDTYECLIANACNFGCSVRPYLVAKSDWYLEFPANMSDDEAKKIMEKVGCPEHGLSRTRYVRPLLMALPERIGNAALAFDEGIGWTTKYALDTEPPID